MGRDSAGDTEEQSVWYTPLSNGYQLEYALFCGYRLIGPDGKPATRFWVTEKDAAEIMIGLAAGQGGC